MSEKYLETKKDSLESSILGVWQTAIEEGDARETAVMDGRTKGYKGHREKLETNRQRRESKKVNKEEVDLDPRKLPDMGDALMQVRTEKRDTHVDPKDREELDKAPSDTAKKMKRAQEPAPGQMTEAQSGDKEAYKKFFDAALKKFKVNSPADLKGDDKKKFYDYIDKNWEGDDEKAEGAMSQVREFKIQSMKAALAQVWGIAEGELPPALKKAIDAKKKDKKEKDEDYDDDEENKKKAKTETGKKPAVIDLKPKIKD